MFKYKKFFKLKKAWQWYNKKNYKEVNENCDAMDVVFAIISIVVMMFELNKLDNYHCCY